MGRFLTRDTYTGEEDEPESLHLYAYCENDGVNAWDPSGQVKFFYGRAKVPKYVFDNDFPYESKKEQQAFMDYVSWLKWEMLLGGSKLLKLSFKEANMLYQHYRSGTGKMVKLVK